jgi:hypothetical protein
MIHAKLYFMIHPMVPKVVRRRAAVGCQLAAVWAVAAAGALAGCGSVTAAVNSDGGGDGGKDLTTFVGTWTLGSGTTTVTCAGVVTTSSVTGNVVWQAGTTSDLLQPADSTSSGCDLLANVSGHTAAALPNQTCNKMGTNLTISSYTFVVGASGTTATETASGTKTVNTGGVGATCTYSETATYTKSP